MIESSSPRRQTRLLPALLGSLLLAACGPSAELAPPAPPALVITAQEGAEASQQVYSGEVRARHEADLAFRIPGKLISRKVEAGSPVKAGDVLAQLDPSDMTLNSDTAQAQALAAEIDYNYSKAELERYDNLLEKKYISPAIHDAKRAMFATSKARLEQARSQARVAGNQAGYATLRADRDGLITLVMAEPGQVVGAGQPVIRLAQADAREVIVAIPESRLAQIKVGDPASVRLWAGEGKPYEGRVREIAPAADMLTRTFSAKIAILDASPEIRLGMTANVTLGLSGEAAVSLPLTAVTQKEGQPQVWIIENGQDGVSRAQPRPVKIGKFSNETASVIEGLKPGEQVIAVGVHKLLPGMAVRPQAMNGATRP
jgi:multidrug efflux system membrane fusion protein